MTDTTLDTRQKKEFGIYYTDELVADFLVSWAVRNPSDRALDPSYGDGVFIISASRQIKALGGKHPQVYGVDIQLDTGFNASLANLPNENFISSDFFKIEPSDIGEMDAVVGNPPFIRYQRFNGETRKNALKICQKMGVALPELTSSWAPFLAHATRFLKKGGRLAMVVPAEINHAAYAQPLVKYFLKVFGKITIVAFRMRIFPNLSQDAYCLLASDYGQECEDFSWIVADDALSLTSIDLNSGVSVDINALRTGQQRLILNLLSEPARQLYAQLSQENFTARLGELASVSIGYVSGANEFFHLSASEVEEYRIPESFLRKAIRSGRQITGLKFTEADWLLSGQSNEKAWLLYIPSNHKKLTEGVREYLEFGVKSNIPETYKCQARQPWYSVPNVYLGDAFLTYMSGNSPKLAANSVKAVASNSLHVVTLTRDLFSQANPVSPENLAALWRTSFTMLSAEVEGHAMGGGMLKLEPSEAEKVMLASPKQYPNNAITEKLDSLLRNSQVDNALDYADKEILVPLGLTHNDCIALREGHNTLREWRMR